MGMIGKQKEIGRCPKCGLPFCYPKAMNNHIAKCTKTTPQSTPAAPPQTPPGIRPPWSADPVPPAAIPVTPGQGQFDFNKFGSTNATNKTYPFPGTQGPGSGAPAPAAGAPGGGYYPGPYGQQMYYQQPAAPTYSFSPGLVLLETGNEILNQLFDSERFKFSAQQKHELTRALAALQTETTDPGTAIKWILLFAWAPPLLLALDDKLDIFTRLKDFLDSKLKKKKKPGEGPDPKGGEDPKLFESRQERRGKIEPENAEETSNIHQVLIRDLDEWRRNPKEIFVKAMCIRCQEVTSVLYDEAPKYLKYGCIGCAPSAWRITQ